MKPSTPTSAATWRLLAHPIQQTINACVVVDAAKAAAPTI